MSCLDLLLVQGSVCDDNIKEIKKYCSINVNYVQIFIFFELFPICYLLFMNEAALDTLSTNICA